MTKFEEKPMATVKMESTSDGNEIKFKLTDALGSYLIEKGEADLYLKLQQQVLPVVPECVGEWIDKNISVAHNAELMIHNILICAIDNKNRYLFPLEVEKFVLKNPITFLNAVITGKYEVEKPQLFKLIFPNSTAVLQKDGELNSFADTVYKRCLIENAMTEQEIKSIDERYWQFAVPVEDGE